MKLVPLLRFPITPGPWRIARPHRILDCDARGQQYIHAKDVSVAVLLDGERDANAQAIAKVPELLQIALWAEAALGYLATKATTAEDRAEFMSRFNDTNATLNEIASK